MLAKFVRVAFLYLFRVLYNAVGKIKNDKRTFFPNQIEAAHEKYLLGFRRPFQKVRRQDVLFLETTGRTI